jgi:hypothetical protein
LDIAASLLYRSAHAQIIDAGSDTMAHRIFFSFDSARQTSMKLDFALDFGWRRGSPLR